MIAGQRLAAGMAGNGTHPSVFPGRCPLIPLIILWNF